jgi:hypothetical protein
MEFDNDNTPSIPHEQIRAIAAAIDRLIAWQHLQAELREQRKYSRRQNREAA